MNRFFAFVLIAWVSGLSCWAEAPPKEVAPLEEIMTPAELTATGVDKLTPAEREALREWMQRFVSGERAEAAEQAVAEAVPQGDDAFGLEDVRDRVVEVFARNGPEAIVSPILGDFTGWTGKTVFRLENGQVWRQAESGDYYLPKDDAVAVIQKGVFGAYYLRIEGYGKRVKVRRVK